MDARVLIKINREALKDAESHGLTAVSTSTLHSIFESIESQLDGTTGQPDPIALEKFRSEMARSLAYEGHVHNWDLEGFKQVIALGQSALKSIMLINGGAAVALLAFVGNLVGNNKSAAVLPFANSMRTFVFGVFLTAIAYVLTYFSQLFYDGQKNWQRNTGFVLHVLTSLVGAGALSAFLWGANSAYLGFAGFSP